MVKIEIELSDIDYEALAEQYLPLVADKLNAGGGAAALLAGGVSGGMAKRMLSAMPQASKDRLAAELINSNRDKLIEVFEDFLAKQRLSARVNGFRAYGV